MRATLSVAALAFLWGCGSMPHSRANPVALTDEQDQRANSWLVGSVQDQAAQNAVVLQHTVFPYHFLPGSAELTDLGKRDLRTLAGHFRKYPGELNVRKDDAPDALYQDRIKVVREFLEHEGISRENVIIVDSHAGGEGMPSEQVIEVLKKSRGEKTGTTAAAPRTAAGGEKTGTTAAAPRTAAGKEQ